MIIPDGQKPLVFLFDNDGTKEYRFVLRKIKDGTKHGFGPALSKPNYLTMHRYGLDIALDCMHQVLRTQRHRPAIDQTSKVS